MYEVIKYKTENGRCLIDEFLDELIEDRSNFKLVTKIEQYINMLSAYGYQINQLFNPKASKRVDDKNGIYELRPDDVRVFYYFISEDQSYVLLHGFVKKKNKAEEEIKKAIREKKDYDRRYKGGKQSIK